MRMASRVVTAGDDTDYNSAEAGDVSLDPSDSMLSSHWDSVNSSPSHSITSLSRPPLSPNTPTCSTLPLSPNSSAASESSASCNTAVRSEQSPPLATSASRSARLHGSCSSLCSSTGFYTKREIEPPQSIDDLHFELLHSGIAILPGSRDVKGNAVVFIFTNSSIWHNRKVFSTELARLLMYYFSVPRREAVCSGLTLVADVRGATSSIVNTLLESLYIFLDNIPGGASTVHMLADSTVQSLVFKSPVYDSSSLFKFDLLQSEEQLYEIVVPAQLPPALDGSFVYSHEEWIRFRTTLEPFLSNCRTVAQYLVEATQELSIAVKAPKSTEETSHLIESHNTCLKGIFSDPRLVQLKTDSETILTSLKQSGTLISHSDDYRYAMDEVNNLDCQLRETILKLVKLNDSQLSKLEQCQQLTEYKEECDKVVSWMTEDGYVALQKHQMVADHLKAIRSQQREFEKFYFLAMTYIEKGNDLLEESSMLSQLGHIDRTAGYRDLAGMLKHHLHDFTTQLEQTREKIEDTAKCYNLLDKSYEWALEAMKYVASMKMEHCASPLGLDKLLKSLEVYLKEHPPLTEDTFLYMIDTAQKLGNDKLLEQCHVAKARCEETFQLLLLRQRTLQRARDQLQVEQKKQSPTRGTPSGCKSALVFRADGDGVTVWDPKTTSTPRHEKLSGTGHNLRPPLSPTSSVNSSSYLSESSTDFPSQDVLENSGSAAARSSSMHVKSQYSNDDGGPRLKGTHVKSQYAKDDANPRLPNSQKNPANGAAGGAKVLASRSISQPIPDQRRSPVSHTRPLKKILKRASTNPSLYGSPLSSTIYEEKESEASGDINRKAKSISMITGSSESLPSMPEDDFEASQDADGEGSEGGGVQGEWTPIPVNTHLLGNQLDSPSECMADLKLTEAELKNRRTLSLIMSEIVQTERDYVRSLQFIISNYIPELRHSNVPQALRGKQNVIFGNIEKIYQFHSQYFLREIEACLHHPFFLGQCFLLHENMFYLYALYNKNKPRSDNLMLEYGKQFFKQKQLQLGDKMDLASYLLKPVQRMGKYALLLKQMVKLCPEQQPEFPDLKAAENMIKFQLRHGNDLLAMDSLRDCDVNLQEQGRLLRQDEFLVWQGWRKSLRRVFLFEDLILFSKTKRGRQGHHDVYVHKFSFKTADLGLTENYGESGYKFEIWFRRRSLGENYILQAPNSEVKKMWVRDISKILWNQALKNREFRLSEMASMGVGSKPCLDLKQSADNIQDRFVNIGLGQRGSRTRASIAVSSFEHLRNGNKRPHSIISVSSTSSSNSSHSSFGLFGSLNLAFDPIDSPQYHRRPSTLLLNESGIGTDISGSEMPDAAVDSGNLTKELKSPISPARPYTDETKPHALRQLSSEPVVTDVSLRMSAGFLSFHYYFCVYIQSVQTCCPGHTPQLTGLCVQDSGLVVSERNVGVGSLTPTH
ncbi:puratrophin-1-like isoform X2 [Gigantopelta aegis]|uniref:puratrophin-1-like isoform X2 n=1 Tax=Gigantopelta aegis TaxID=1735272 RepID=UPI001B88CAAB|nr:puratrophin-1-like isoform X2 [Gigantopelta aegis]